MTEKRQVRGWNDGTISRRKDGRWEIRIQDPVTGKRRSAYAKSETEARRKLREMITKAEQGLGTLDSAMRLDAYLEEWLKATPPGRRAESTMREYERRLRMHVMPVIGHKKLRSLTVVDVERMLNRCAEQGLGRESIRGVRNAFAAALTDAKRQRLVNANVATHAVLPRTTAPRQKPRATVAEVHDLLEAARDTEMGDLLAVLAGTGCRIGEALGATWADFDLAAGEWRLQRTTTMNSKGAVVVADRTKTGEARIVALSGLALDALNRQRRRVAEKRLKAGKVWRDHDLVFPSSVGTPQDSRNLRRDFRTYAEASGFRHSFHELRHFFATVAASEVTLESLSKVLGHKRRATTSDIYGHLYEPDARKVTNAVEKVLRADDSA
jgi:integrase